MGNYLDVRNDPLFPFGFGLSYTTFHYGVPRLSGSAMTVDGSLTLTVNVKNTGRYDGAEVVQLYIRDVAATISRQVKELKGFERIFLKAGESRDVVFTIDSEMLWFLSNARFSSIPYCHVASSLATICTFSALDRGKRLKKLSWLM